MTSPFMLKAGNAGAIRVAGEQIQVSADDFIQPEAPPAAPARSKRILQGTDQQEALWHELLTGNTHVIAEARAGCGKSSSCREAMWRLFDADPRKVIRYAVFNKSNADELRSDFPSGVGVGTIHSFGFNALKVAHRSQLEKNKSYMIMDESREGRNLPRYMRKSASMLVGLAKNHAYQPGQTPEADLWDLLTHFEVNDYGRPGLIVHVAELVLKKSAEWHEVVDFDDMIWLPGLLGTELQFPGCDVLFLDEVQDWNRAQHALVSRLCARGRVIAVGDRHQAIYAFRGADADTMPNLEKLLSTQGQVVEHYPLTKTFRCPKSHVKLANDYVPDLEAFEGNIEGTIDHAPDDQVVLEAQPGDMILCWQNAPVIRACLRLIDQRTPAIVRGRAIGDKLITVLRQIGDCRTISDLCYGIRRWRNRELMGLEQMEGVEDLVEAANDKAAGLSAIAAICDSPAEVEMQIQSLFSDGAPTGAQVVCSTVHRAKGLEADTIWLLDTQTRPPTTDWQERQQANLRYVAYTRSKNRLVLCDCAGDAGA